jgi:hypothetical protein
VRVHPGSSSPPSTDDKLAVGLGETASRYRIGVQVPRCAGGSAQPRDRPVDPVRPCPSSFGRVRQRELEMLGLLVTARRHSGQAIICTRGGGDAGPGL